MDPILFAALEEICVEGVKGIPLQKLWPRLQVSLASSGLHPCDAVKEAIWKRLLIHPGLNFEVQGSSLDSQDPSIQSFEESEKLGLKLVAEKHLRDSFLGLCDLKAANSEIPQLQRRVLERLAAARTAGRTQNDLAKELGLKGNDMFYHVKNLECQRLVVRQSTDVRTKESGTEGDYENKTSHRVTTNLIHLYRFAKHLNSNSQQKLEITKPGLGESHGDIDGSLLTQDDASGECMEEDVRVKDYLPAMKAVCDKLEEASGKVLAVQDIKQTLGYRKTQGHRAWRNICNRLKEANLVEEVQAKENKKNVRCLRLQKKFDPKDFLPKPIMCGYDDFDSELVKCGKRGQITDQLVELPIEHRIYDIIDAEGPNGITIPEVCKRLGLNGKKNYTRIVDMRSRFGICMHAETQNTTKLYRLWTPRNFKDYSFTVFPGNCGEGPEISSWSPKDLVPCEQSSSNFLQFDSSSKNEFFHHTEVDNAPMGLESSIDCSSHLDDVRTVVPGIGPKECAPVIVSIDHDSKHNEAMEVTASDSALSKRPFPVLSTLKLPSSRRYPCLPTIVVSDQRKQRILTRLKNEKFILMVELHKWLDGLEKHKGTTMDRKTLTRSLNRLQKEGQCKCVQVTVPILTHYSRSRTAGVILHPSIESLSSELLVEIRERQRYFDMQNRGRGSTKSKNDERLAVVLEDVKRPPHHVGSNDQFANAEAMRANGFVPAKMVRAKLFHKFLWCYISSMPDWHLSLSSEKHGYDPKNPQSTLKLFSLDSAIKAMPLELFLQVVGSAKSVDNLVENCRRGLCLSDLSVQEYKCLLDAPANVRLSRIIGVLFRLKLIQLVDEGPAVDVNVLAHAILRHAMELKPYIEAPRARPSFNSNSSDFRPRIRHDFIFFNREAVDAYWQTLEYCYARAGPSVASHAFPGSAVPEVFFFRSWASVRVMTAEQHTELLKRVANDDPNGKVLFKDCVKIATELNLTLEQVLRASYDKRRSRRNKSHQYMKSKEQESHLNKTASIARKRKRSSKNRLSDHVPNDTKHVDVSRPIMLNKSDTDVICMKKSSCRPTTVDNVDNHLQPFEDESNLNAALEHESYEDGGENCDLIHQYAFSRLKPKRRRKFPWTDDLDRQLVIQYARYRAMLGARFSRVDWASVSDLPALRDTCRRRLSVLTDNLSIRTAVLRLCNLLGERYAQYHGKRDFKDSEKIIQNLPAGGSPQNSTVLHEFTFCSNLQGGLWDDFEDLQIKMAVEEVLRCKRMAKHENSSRVGSRNEKEWTDIPPPDGEKSDVFDPLEKQISVSLLTAGGEIPGHIERHKKYSSLVPSTSRRRSRPHCLQGKSFKIWNNRGISIERQVHESLAVSSAVELLKLVFLSTSAAPEVQALLAETLKQYSERELFAAFNYLRDKNFMVLGLGCKPFVLSQQFWRSASSSPFPIDSGKRAANFSTWLHGQEADLMEDGANLSVDLQCGEIFHLFALVSSGELLISPCLPNEGLGEADEPKNLDSGIDDNIKKQIPQWKISNDYCTRGDKGFPGIKILLSRATVSWAEILDSNMEKYTCLLQFDKNYPVNCFTLSTEDTPLQRDSCHDFRNSGLSNVSLNGSFWEAVASCAKLMSSTNIGKKQKAIYSADLIKSVYTSIQQAGEQGLKMEEIPQAIIQGEQLAEIVVDSLEVFQLVIKVNAYDCVRAVDSLYRSKYFITTLAGHSEDLKPSSSSMNSQKMDLETSQRLLPEKQPSGVPGAWDETDMNICSGHKVTLLDLPEPSSSQPFFGTQPTEEEGVSFQDHMQTKALLDQGNEETTKYSDLKGPVMSRPLLPWINGDGSTNSTVYKGLVRRVLGTVMQNPGIMEEDLINRMDVLNPQSCKQLLELMALDNHIMTRKMLQTTTSNAPPAILQSLFRPNYRESKSMFRKHIFANPMSTPLL